MSVQLKRRCNQTGTGVIQMEEASASGGVCGSQPRRLAVLDPIGNTERVGSRRAPLVLECGPKGNGEPLGSLERK